jgi:hypothetical protein
MRQTDLKSERRQCWLGTFLVCAEKGRPNRSCHLPMRIPWHASCVMGAPERLLMLICLKNCGIESISNGNGHFKHKHERERLTSATLLMLSNNLGHLSADAAVVSTTRRHPGASLIQEVQA